MVRLIVLPIPEQVVILETKTQGQNKIVKHQHENTEHVALMLPWRMGFPLGTSPHGAPR